MPTTKDTKGVTSKRKKRAVSSKATTAGLRKRNTPYPIARPSRFTQTVEQLFEEGERIAARLTKITLSLFLLFWLSNDLYYMTVTETAPPFPKQQTQTTKR